MLVIWVICSVVAYSVYIVIKYKIDEWLNQPRMSRLNLKRSKKRFKDVSGDISSADENSIDIETCIPLPSSQIPSSSSEYSKATTSMFLWSPKRVNSNEIICVDSDSSDDSGNELDKRFHQQTWKKYKKCNEEHNVEINEDPSPKVLIQYEYTISGIKIKFPVKPYPCQIAVMNKVIQGCVKSENCLLESPTGTGKTLALICSSLGWQDHLDHANKLRAASNSEVAEDNNLSKQTCGSPLNKESTSKDSFEDESKSNPKIPSIYYCARTHKQLEQVVKELRKTGYTHKKMTILSSREHTCIQDNNRNKTELCNELLDPTKHKGCRFYNEANKKAFSSFTALEMRGLSPVWDIEELVNLGKDAGVCPYFGARNLVDQADIIFCPYNYILNPDIRENMQLDLRGQVIILDEAHNIENACREEASVDFREDHLQVAAVECGTIADQRKEDFRTYNTLEVYITKLVEFIKTNPLRAVDRTSDTQSSPYWTGSELLELFKMHELGGSAFETFLVASKTAIADLNSMKEDSKIPETYLKPVICANTKKVLEHLVFSMRMITSQVFANDYSACIMENTVKDYKLVIEGAWQSSGRQEKRARTLKLICMNPGVIFAPLAEMAHSIIVASGTLTPIASFQSELNTKFAHVLNAKYIIPKEQVFAACLPKGPNGISLKAVYGNINTWEFQDELGAVLQQVCNTVPHGVLCFVPSYTVIDKLTNRWKNTQMWKRISNSKEIFIEPRGDGDLGDIMTQFRKIIIDTSDGPVRGQNGALFLGVFRGKLAEGIDFKDNEARCVMSVGIPYANRKDPVVDMKYKYNDANVSKGLLSGSQWYSTQTFRALNQALGRCLRHINDWGAVIIVDERFTAKENKDNLSTWVRAMLVDNATVNFEGRLRNFVAQRKKNE